MERCGISKLDLKRRNRMQILRVIRENGAISRVDISAALKITRAAVTIITNEMIEQGVLIELGEAPVYQEKLQKGRRKILVGINENYKFAIGAVIAENEVSVGLSNIKLDVLDKAFMPINDKTSSKDIISFIIQKTNEMITNSCLKNEDVIGVGIGVMPCMWGKLNIFYKDGVLDFNNFIGKISSGVSLDVVCGNAIGLMSMANNDFENYNGYQTNQILLHFSNQFNFAVLNKNELSSDYMSYTNMIEKFIVNPNGRIIDGYPQGSVKSELSGFAMKTAFKEIYSSSKCPLLYDQTAGDFNNIDNDAILTSYLRGEEAVVEIVNQFIESLSILINNLVVVNFAQKVVLSNFNLNEKQFEILKRGIVSKVGEDIADKVVLSKFDDSNSFIGGCSLVIQKSFYDKGGLYTK